MIDNELMNCTTKGDYIKYVIKYSHDIQDIDTAIPIKVRRDITENGIEGYFVTVYYADGVIRYSDVICLATLVSKQREII